MKPAWCAVILLAALSLLPTLLVDIPAMADYLNHLARMHLLADAGTANENPYYEISFALYPNLAMDLIVPQLARFLEVERATRFFFFGSQVLIVAGAITLEWTVKRRHEMAGSRRCWRCRPRRSRSGSRTSSSASELPFSASPRGSRASTADGRSDWPSMRCSSVPCSWLTSSPSGFMAWCWDSTSCGECSWAGSKPRARPRP